LSEGRSPVPREFQREFKQKAVAVTTPAELHTALARAARLSVPVILQELVPGPASAIYHVSLYADQASNVRGVFVARKQRQYPSQFGDGCMIETVVGPEIAGLAATLIKAMRFHGIAGALEFKRHGLTGRLHFIEINPRAASSIAATNASGANLPYLAYLDAIGAELPGITVGETSVRWIDARRDVLYWLSYRKSDHTGRALPLREYVGSLRGRREYAYWATDDPMPAVSRATSLPRDAWLACKN
jgi:predicted ATP-grasp superfamily ATP-dependent carboligase